MARKRSSDEAGVSLDSLMDALTNVVAVLILVLILVQADVTQKVEEFLDNLKPATPEEVQQSKEQLAKVREELERKQALLQQEAPTPAAIEEEKRSIALLEKELKDNSELLADLDELKRLERKLRLERDVEQEKTSKIEEEIARLLAQLDATPEKVAKPDIVTIPSSRPIPATAKIYYAIVQRGRVHLIDPFTPVELFEDEFRQEKRHWLLERVKRQGADRYIYDGRKIEAHFKDFDFKNRRNQRVTLVAPPTGTRMRIEIRPDLKEGGTTTEQLAEPNSQFAASVKALSRIRGAVLMFWVHPDSFPTYLKARPLADAVNLPAGWEIRFNQMYAVTLSDVEIRRQKEPPPAKPDPNPQPKPPRLGPKLD
ncbi:hypothetical protein [Haloferula rosea]|uniref:Uncharacterized protein n=1 Tax=Haloferula rosea TaxID=490093 RepID=A0A934RC94_9BACT|nr:hypothetical protein [Haloferula rosea]MBK1827890.1 hypothetical protein [Haloferula rosea]